MNLAAFPKSPPLRDRAYLDWLREQRCIFTGRYGNDFESVVPAHIGTAGKSMKSPDNEALPILDSVHKRMHQQGEISVLRDAPDGVIRAAFRALAREMYAGYRRS